MDCLNSSQVVEISRVLVVGNVLREVGLDDELPGLLIEVLRQIRSQDDVCDGCLADEILMQAGSLVRFKHQLSYLRKETELLIGNSDEVHGFSAEVVKRSKLTFLSLASTKSPNSLAFL